MAFAVVACHTNDIDNPDNPDNPNPPQISDNVTFTASIKQTRVEYTPNGNKLDQCWKPNDVIYGFYGEGSGSKIILQVTNVDSYGNATLEPQYGTGPDFVAELKESVKNEEDLTIGLIYTGKTKITDNSYGNDIYVYFTNQSTGQIPACMKCYDASNTDEDGNTIVEFKFENNCAIMEIKGITGAKEEADLSEGEKKELETVTVTNTITSLHYLYDGGFSLEINADYMGYTYVEPESLYIDSNGNIVDSNGNSKSVMIAVVPNSTKKDIEVTAEVSGGDTFGSSYNTDFAAGTCYVIRQKDVVAKTEDGLYFTSVFGAFDHASTLVSTFGDNNTVTLVKDYINGLNEDVAHEEDNHPATIIDIDYPVTLDLNGCTLSLDCNSKHWEWDSFYSGGFNVLSGGTLTIDDSKGSGCIDSGSKEIPIISNSGTVNILGGSLRHWESCNVVDSTGDLNVYDGLLYAYDSPAVTLTGSNADCNIYGGIIENDPFDTSSETLQILNGADCIISGGVIYSSTGWDPAVVCRSTSTDVKASSLTIKWPDGIEPASGDTRYEPFILCETEELHYAPVSTYDALNTNTAVVTIQGGYIITTANENSKNYLFYCGDNAENGNLVVDDFGGFYTNSSWIHLYTSGEQYDSQRNLVDPGTLAKDSGRQIGGKTFIAESGYEEISKTIDSFSFSTGALYYITEKL